MSRLLPRTLRPTLGPTFRPTTTTLRPYSSSTFASSPSPPRLPADQQAEFERLQRAAEAALSTHTTIPAAPSSSIPSSSPAATSRHATSPSTNPASATTTTTEPAIHPEAALEGEATFSGGIRRGAPPEFEGERNPKTGEVGGPKNEPLRWGGEGDWSYNGRVTDF